MLFYLIIYFISSIFCAIGSNCFKINKKNIGIFFSIIAILIPCIISGFRIKTIGTDTSKYVASTFDAALHGTGYKEAFKYMDNVANVEYLYKLINYIISRITNNVNWIYFSISLITTTFVYLACYNNRTQSGNYSISYFAFLVLFFNRSFNLSRQSLSIAIILYASKYIFEKDLRKYVFFCIIASGFHSTSIFFTLLYFIVNYIIKGKAKTIKKVFLVLTTLLFVLQYQNILLFIINEMGILDRRYLFYVIDYTNKGTNILLIELLFIGFLIITTFIFRKNIQNEKIKIYSLFIVLSFIIYLIGIYASYAFRLSYYLYAFCIFVIQYLTEIYKQKNDRIIVTIIACTILCFYSYLYYDVYKFDQTVPYKSIISKMEVK